MGAKIHFLAEKAVEKLPATPQFVRDSHEVEWIHDYQKFSKSTVAQEKRRIIFARKRGPWIKPFHCYDHPEYRYFSLDLAEGCLFDCVYCYLQSYLNHQALVLFVPEPDLYTELRQLRGKCWISTGLLSDSLLAENHLPVLSLISREIPSDCLLELRSKSGDTDVLRDPEIDRSRVVISWSLNPDSIARRYEYRAASLAERLQAAHQAAELGYRIGFHFDPVFHFSGWEGSYEALIHHLEDFAPNQIAFLSVGLFRYMPSLGTIIRKRFPYHEVLSGEFFTDQDGKYHYLRSVRKEMYQKFQQWMRDWQSRVPVFWSMEPQPELINFTR
jgi:DNA repair photolyase